MSLDNESQGNLFTGDGPELLRGEPRGGEMISFPQRRGAKAGPCSFRWN